MWNITSGNKLCSLQETIDVIKHFYFKIVN